MGVGYNRSRSNPLELRIKSGQDHYTIGTKQWQGCNANSRHGGITVRTTLGQELFDDEDGTVDVCKKTVTFSCKM